MDKFLENWKNDHRYRAKIKLSLYSLFILLVSVYAISLNNKAPINNENNQKESVNEPVNTDNKNIINIPNDYTYLIDINVNSDNYKYYGTYLDNEMTIIKEHENNTTSYLYKNNDYYIKKEDLYIKTTKENIYDIIDYNYLDLSNINAYLNTSEKVGNEYHVYLKDIILDYNSDDYIIVTINNNDINIDYTNLMKILNNSINLCTVNIKIEEKNEIGG